MEKCRTYKYWFKWTKNNPKKHKAQYDFNDMRKRNNIQKEKCYFCDSMYTVAHHEDYNRPFFVVWLCRYHHRQIHLGKISFPNPVDEDKAFRNYKDIVGEKYKRRMGDAEKRQNKVIAMRKSGYSIEEIKKALGYKADWSIYRIIKNRT